jgi:hypothetical protein
MLVATHDDFLTDGASLPTHELLEIHRSKISLQHAKVGYDYPTIRLPYTFSKLAGLSTRIYQTIYDGSLAFLTVISPTENASKHPKPSPLHGEGRAFESPSAKASLIARVGVLNFRDSRNPSLF